MQFEFATAATIVFGPGSLMTTLPRLTAWGRQAMVVCGATTERHAPFFERLESAGISVHRLRVVGEPSVDSVAEGAAQARQARCDMVIGIGGGSVIDTGKAIAALLTNSGRLTDYLEIVGKGYPLQNASAPFVAIPTTAGTGAEVTRNSVLTSSKHRLKVSMRSPGMLPRLVVVDPELALSLPPGPTAATGMDALTQLIEAFVSRKANPITDGLCREGLMRCARSLLRAYQNGGDLDARMDMALASLFSGLALANGGLGAVHGIAGPLGGHIAIPHGVACSCLLSPVWAANVRRLASTDHRPQILQRYREIARLLTGQPDADMAQATAWIDRRCRQMQLPVLSRFGLQEADLAIIATRALNASSMRGNPVNLDQADLIAILRQALATA